MLPTASKLLFLLCRYIAWIWNRTITLVLTISCRLNITIESHDSRIWLDRSLKFRWVSENMWNGERKWNSNQYLMKLNVNIKFSWEITCSTRRIRSYCLDCILVDPCTYYKQFFPCTPHQCNPFDGKYYLTYSKLDYKKGRLVLVSMANECDDFVD